jgi:hypothetical protein
MSAGRLASAILWTVIAVIVAMPLSAWLTIALWFRLPAPIHDRVRERLCRACGAKKWATRFMQWKYVLCRTFGKARRFQGALQELALEPLGTAKTIRARQRRRADCLHT